MMIWFLRIVYLIRWPTIIARAARIGGRTKHDFIKNHSILSIPKALSIIIKRNIIFISCQQFPNLLNSLFPQKGTPNEPRCGFSRQTISLLNTHNILYKTFDILSDDDVRSGLKEYSNWPTYPQLYVNGELVGGLDILKEMSEAGELVDLIPKECIKA